MQSPAFQHQADSRLEESEARLRFLAEAGLALASSLDYEATLKRVAELAIQSLADFCFFHLLVGDGRIRRVAWAHRDPVQRARLDEAPRFVLPGTTPQRSPITAVIESGEPIFVPVVDEAWMRRTAISEAHYEFMRELDFHSVMIVPVRGHDRTIGAITFCRSGPAKEQHTPEDLELALELGRRAGIAVLHARQHQALTESEARFRNMADSAPALIWMTNSEGALTFANMHHDHMFGRPAASLLGDRWWREIVLPDDVAAFEQAFAAAFEARRPFQAQVRVCDRNNDIRWLRCEGVPRLSDAGAFLGYTGCNVDITSAKVAEERQQLLIHELNHRVKNTLAIVQAIASQTLRAPTPLEQAREAFANRIVTLAQAHDVLTRENWAGADLTEIVAEAVRVHEATDAHRFNVQGPRVRLAPQVALSLALALHELATNATKYGALSNETGGIDITWSVMDEDGSRVLRLEWREHDGPPVAPPTRKGFGSRLIERGIGADIRGDVRLDYRPEGVVCVVTAPLG